MIYTGITDILHVQGGLQHCDNNPDLNLPTTGIKKLMKVQRKITIAGSKNFPLVDPLVADNVLDRRKYYKKEEGNGTKTHFIPIIAGKCI